MGGGQTQPGNSNMNNMNMFSSSFISNPGTPMNNMVNFDFSRNTPRGGNMPFNMNQSMSMIENNSGIYGKAKDGRNLNDYVQNLLQNNKKK